MFKQLKDLAGGEFYLITSLIIFMVFFFIVAVYLYKMSKSHIQIMSNLPFENKQIHTDEED
ncbi:MAG: hypothetical protein EOO98_02810 [Pedobacter sp.]|nr:MAG: hypothetical protein EOO98_02810 [Pedobacter sp.]